MYFIRIKSQDRNVVESLFLVSLNMKVTGSRPVSGEGVAGDYQTRKKRDAKKNNEVVIRRYSTAK